MTKAEKHVANGDGQDQPTEAFFTSLDVESLVVDPLEGATAPLLKQNGRSPVEYAMSSADATARKILADAKKAFNLSNARKGTYQGRNQKLSTKEQSSSEDSLWSSAGDNAPVSIESLLLNRIHEVVAFADEHVVAPTGEAILKSGEVISHMGSLLRSREEKSDHSNDIDEKSREYSIEADPPIIDIHLPCGGDEVELIARSSDEEDYDNIHANPDSLLLHLRQLPMEDQILSPMNLRLIRGKDFSFDNTRLRISVLNEDGHIDQILGTTPWTNKNRNPIWGTVGTFWSIMGTPSTCFIFSLEGADSEVDDTTEKKEDCVGEQPKSRIFTKVLAGDLLARKRNPNVWIRLTNSGSEQLQKCGFIRLRLSRPKRAVLHQQENCPRITPGPAFPRMESYAIRKKAMYSCSPVILNVYDVSNDSRVETVNNTVKTLGYGGIFHAAIQIHGKEFSFGGTRDKNSNVGGIFCSPPKQCPMHHYRESVFLGDCELSLQQVNCILDGLRPKWLARDYNIFRKNCAFFSRDFAIELGVGDIPEWVFSLATTAEFIEPYAIKLNNYIANRAKVQHTRTTAVDSKQSRRRTILTREASEVLAVALEEDGSLELQRAATSPQHTLLDHAMAARIQRSFRATSSKKLPVANHNRNRT